MSVLKLGYRNCDRKRPKFLKNPEIEAVAALARQQLLDATTDAMSVKVLSAISGLNINGVEFDLFIGTGNLVHDDRGDLVLGICEFDPGVPDTAMLSVSPVGEHGSEELVLSTLGHELGHVVFDAPGWIVDASKGPGLFDDAADAARKSYRTTTKDGEHLAKSGSVKVKSETYFAELRANEFMGSLLVPRQNLSRCAQELASAHHVRIHRSPSLDPEMPGTVVRLSGVGDFGDENLGNLQKVLASHFGVHRRFIEVRMERYGLLAPVA